MQVCKLQYSVYGTAVWLNGSALVSINEVTLRQAQFTTGMGDQSGVQLPVPAT